MRGVPSKQSRTRAPPLRMGNRAPLQVWAPVKAFRAPAPIQRSTLAGEDNQPKMAKARRPFENCAPKPFGFQRFMLASFGLASSYYNPQPVLGGSTFFRVSPRNDHRCGAGHALRAVHQPQLSRAWTKRPGTRGNTGTLLLTNHPTGGFL